MTRKLPPLLLAVLLLFSCAASALAREQRVLVFLEEGDGFTVEENGRRVLPGEDAAFTVILDRGVVLTGTDYPGETAMETNGRTVRLTLRAVACPTRVRLTLSTQACAIVYEGNGAFTPAGETAVEKRYSLSAHPRPNTDTGRALFSRAGYTLVCWNTRSDGAGERIGLGSRVTPVNGRARLFAQWAPWSDAADFDWIGEDAAVITGYHGDAEVLVIPARLDGKPVKSIAAGAFSGCGAREIILPDTLRTVESGAFQDCALTALTLFDSIEWIPDEAFVRCPGLQTLHINAAEPPFGYVFRRESVYADKVELLIRAQGKKKLVFYGGCSMWYNLDAHQADALLGDEYAIINMGINGLASSALQLQIIAPFLSPGDILFHTPELYSAQQLMLKTDMTPDDSSMWAGIENNYDLFALVDLRQIHGAFTSLSGYLSLKDSQADYQQYYADEHSMPYMDEYGSIPFFRSGTKDNLPDKVRLDPSLYTAEALDTLAAYYAWLMGRGVQVLVSYACINMDAVPPAQQDKVEETDAAFRRAIEAMHGPVLISRLSDYLFRGNDFYDTNYHLCSEPARRNTAQWMKDLEGWMRHEE